MNKDIKKLSRSELLELLIEKERKFEDLSAEYNQINLNNESLSNKIELLSAENEKQKLNNEDYIIEIESLKMERRKAEDELNLLKEKNAELTVMTNSLSEEISKKQEEIEQSNKKLDESKMEIAEQINNINTLLNENEKLRDSLKSKEQENNDLFDAIEQLKNNLIIEENQNKEMCEEISALKEKLLRKQGDCDELVLRIEQLEGAFSTNNNSLLQGSNMIESNSDDSTILNDIEVNEQENTESETEPNSETLDNALDNNSINFDDEEKNNIDIKNENASDRLSNIFKTAQLKADQYVEAMKARNDNQEKICNKLRADTILRCREMEEKKKAICESMIEQVKTETEAILNQVSQKAGNISRHQDELYQELLEKIISMDY